jgi:hypothetical protein
MKGRVMNKLTALLFGSTLSLCLNAQISLGPTVGTFGVLAGSTVTTSGPTVVVGNLGPLPGLPESLGIERMKERDPTEAFGCTIDAGQEF